MPLPQRALLRLEVVALPVVVDEGVVQGPDAAQHLQGLVTNNVLIAEPHSATCRHPHRLSD